MENRSAPLTLLNLLVPVVPVVRFSRREGIGFSLADPKVDHFDKYGKGHGEVDVSLGDMERETIGDQSHPDQEEKTQGQDLDGGMLFDKSADAVRGR